jgi:hypothetical protein
MRQPSITTRVPTAKRTVFSGRRSIEIVRSQDGVQLTRLLESTAAFTLSSATASAITDALHCNTPTAS